MVDYNGSGGTGPFVQTVSLPQSFTLTFQGSNNSPFALFNANPGAGGTILTPGFPTPYGNVDIGPIGFPPIELVLDGISAQGTLLGSILNTGPYGNTSFAMNLTGATAPCTTITSSLANIQALFLTPASPSFVLSAAWSFQLPGAPPPDTSPQTITQCDDCTFELRFANCNTFQFYGQSYYTAFVSSNGNITFGSPDASFTEYQSAFDSGPARIAPLWDDLFPVTGGVTKFDNGSTVVVQWTSVQEYGAPASLNTSGVTLDLTTGLISFQYGPVGSIDSIVGVTPGNNTASLVTVFGPSAPNGSLLSHVGNSYAGGAMESLNEVFGAGAGTTNFNLANSSFALYPGAGNTSYTVY